MAMLDIMNQLLHEHLADTKAARGFLHCDAPKFTVAPFFIDNASGGSNHLAILELEFSCIVHSSSKDGRTHF